MSGVEFVAGDVAIVTDKWGRTGRGICNAKGGWDFTQDGKSLSNYAMATEVVDVRPLVVIDPEDRESVLRLGELIRKHSPWTDDAPALHLTDALREFANPTPPKPDEPTGLGAVVEDADGKRWVRLDDKGAAWYPANVPGSTRCWDDFAAAVRVLSEGVTND